MVHKSAALDYLSRQEAQDPSIILQAVWLVIIVEQASGLYCLIHAIVKHSFFSKSAGSYLEVIIRARFLKNYIPGTFVISKLFHSISPHYRL